MDAARQSGSDASPAHGVLALEADRAGRVLRRLYPALTRALGPNEVARLGHELILSHPFAVGSGLDLAALWPDFLAAELRPAPPESAWLAELARFEESLAWVAQGGEVARLTCEFRIDEVHAQLLQAGVWDAPRPGRSVFAFDRGAHGPRATESRRSMDAA